MKRRLIRIAVILLVFPPVLAGVAGWLVAPGFLHPQRRELTPDLVREADASFSTSASHREDFNVRAPDGVMLHGWKVRPPRPNGDWVLLFHGVADNRVGVIGQSEFLLKAGYSVVMMDARAHGASEGAMATYGWLERNDTRTVIDALLRPGPPHKISIQMSPPYIPPGFARSPVPAGPARIAPALSPPPHIFALGESMGAGIALQSAAADPRIEGVVAEAAFANMREASYDYAGLRKSPWLGKTLLAPFGWTLLYRGGKIGGIDISQISPEKAVASRNFPVLLICDEKDEALPCRHTERIYAAATGPKQIWEVPGAFHTAAYGFEPVEFRRRVLAFYASIAAQNAGPATGPNAATGGVGNSPSDGAGKKKQGEN